MIEHEWYWWWWGGGYCKYARIVKNQAREHCDKNKSETCPAELHIFDDDVKEDKNKNV